MDYVASCRADWCRICRVGSSDTERAVECWKEVPEAGPRSPGLCPMMWRCTLLSANPIPGSPRAWRSACPRGLSLLEPSGCPRHPCARTSEPPAAPSHTWPAPGPTYTFLPTLPSLRVPRAACPHVLSPARPSTPRWPLHCPAGRRQAQLPHSQLSAHRAPPSSPQAAAPAAAAVKDVASQVLLCWGPKVHSPGGWLPSIGSQSWR